MDSTTEQKRLLGDLIDFAVEEPAKADALLAEHPELLAGRWILGETPLHFLAVESHPTGVRWFAEHGIDVNAPNDFGDTALLDAVSLQNLPMVELLLSLGANPNIFPKMRDSALEMAVLAGSPLLVKTLLDAGAEVQSGGDPEHLAGALSMCSGNREEILALLQRAAPEVEWTHLLVPEHR